MSSQNSNALQAAAEWYLQLTSGEATDADYEAWQAWKSANAEHEHAWQNVEAVTHPFTTIDATIALAALDGTATAQSKLSNKPVSESRRQAIKHLSLLLALGASGWFTYREKPWQGILADYSTQVGEHRQMVLQDGTRLLLNTDSMVAVDFSDKQRIVTLFKGEVLVETGHEHLETYRPFILKTEHGSVTALGTRFSTRRHEEYTSVNLYEGSVNIAPEQGGQDHIVLVAGEFAEFSKTSIIQKALAAPGSDAWSTGFLIADKMPLGDFLAELSRYRQGVIRCDPDIAQLQISGAFPIHDIDAALVSVAKTLPIRIETFTRYWILVKPA